MGILHDFFTLEYLTLEELSEIESELYQAVKEVQAKIKEVKDADIQNPPA